MNGSEGTLILRAHGKTAITLRLDGAIPQGADTYAFSVDLGSLRLGENERIQWNYDLVQQGGRAISQKGGLIPVGFTCAIKATTAVARINAYNELMAAIANVRGGTLEYVPEGVSTSTFYHYQSSSPPILHESPSNRWDRDAQSDGLFTLVIDVEMMTQPFATSDPDPAVIIDIMDTNQTGRTVVPGEGTYAPIGLTDHLEIANLGGTEPVLSRMLVYGADGQDIGRVIASRKSGAGRETDNITSALNATIVGEDAYWSLVYDADRYEDYYRKIRPPVDLNGEEYTHRYSLSDVADWTGRFAIFVDGYDESEVTGAWTHKAALVLGNKQVQESDDHYARLYGNWQLVYIGELEIPPASFSLGEEDAGYALNESIDIVSTRHSGASGFRFGALILIQVSDRDNHVGVIDVVCDQDDKIEGFERLLIENQADEQGQPLEVAHALTSGDLRFKRTLSIAPRGEFPSFDPEQEHLVNFVSERALVTPFIENLNLYEGKYYQELGNFWSENLYPEPYESDEGWALTSNSYYSDFLIYQGLVLEGTYYGVIRATTDVAHAGYGRIERNVALDYSGETSVFTEDDMFCFTRQWNDSIGEVDVARIGFIDGAGVAAYTTFQLLQAGAVHRAVRRSDLASAQDINWGNIRKVYVEYGVKAGSGNLNTELFIDHIRVEKRNYTNLSEPDVTGGQWSFDDGKIWTLTRDTARWIFTWWEMGLSGRVGGWRRDLGVTLSTVTMNYDLSTALLNEDAAEYFQYSVRIMNNNYLQGFIGLFWCGDSDFLIGGSQNGYRVVVEYSDQVATVDILIEKITAGVGSRPADIDPGDDLVTLSSEIREPIYFGIKVDRSTGAAEVYAVPESDAKSDHDVWLDENLIWSYTETDFMTKTKCGLFSWNWARIRADKIILRDANDRLNIGDSIEVAIQGQYRTVTPLT